MTATGYEVIADKKAQLIRKALEGSFFTAPMAEDVITLTNLFDATSGDLKALPDTYADLGYLDDSGAKVNRAIKVADVTSWGSNDPTRTDVTNDVTTVHLVAQETRLSTIGLHAGVDVSGLEGAHLTGLLKVDQPLITPNLRYRGLLVAVDVDPDNGEFVVARTFPKMGVTDIAEQDYSNGSAPITWGVTLTAYPDSAAGFAARWLFGGAGWAALCADMGVTMAGA